MRFRKGDDTFDVWVEKVGGGDVLWSRTNTEPPQLIEYARDSDLHDLVLDRLTKGWQRDRDPTNEVELDQEPSEPALEAALIADLADGDAALVYADWYQQHHHPRGDLIAVQHAKARDPSPALDEAEAELFARWPVHLLGPLDRPREAYHLGLDLEWQHGFIRAARIDGKGDHGEQLLWELLRHPSARLLRELVIGCHRFGDQDNQLMTALLLHAGPTPPLRKLVLADFDDSGTDNIDISRAWLGDLRGLSDRYPLLEDVVIKGRGIGARDNAKADGGLGGLALLRAKRFAFRTSGLMRETLAAILAAPWPELAELEIWVGTSEYGMTCTPADLDPLLRGSAPPKLRILRILDVEFSDELCPALIHFVHTHPLDELDLSYGTLTDAGASVLLANASVFANLGTLRIYDNCLSSTGLALLRDANLPLDETPPFPGDGWQMSDLYDRIGSQKNDRYVSVSE